jgi:hypothetical protein
LSGFIASVNYVQGASAVSENIGVKTDLLQFGHCFAVFVHNGENIVRSPFFPALLAYIVHFFASLTLGIDPLPVEIQILAFHTFSRPFYTFLKPP